MALNDTSGVSTGFELIPDKTLAKAVLTIDPPKVGKPSIGMESITKDGNGRFLNIVAKISEGPHKGRTVRTTLCTIPNGSEGHAKWENGSDKMMACILEQARGANKQTNPAGYRLAPAGAPHPALVNAVVAAINGAEVIIKISEQAGKDGFDDQNSFAVVPKWDSKGGVAKDFAAYSKPVNAAGAGVAPVANYGVNQPQLNTASQAAYPNTGGNASMPQAGYNPQYTNPNTVANPLSSPPPSFIDQDDVPPFDV